MRNRRQGRPPKLRGGSFEFVGEPIVFVCPFCPGGNTVVHAGTVRLRGSKETTDAVLHPVPMCEEYRTRDPVDFLRTSREHYEQHGRRCDHCGKSMISARSRKEEMEEATRLWGPIPDDHLVLCDVCFGAEVQRRSRGQA